MEARQRTILIVDDNRTFAMYLGLLLRRLSFRALSAPSVRDAHELLKSETVDAIISEATTRSYNGMELLETLKALNLSDKIPLLITATHGNDQDRANYLAAGASDFMVKPITPAQLHRHLNQYLHFETGKRRYPRVNLNHKVVVETTAATYDLYLTSLSEGGAFIRHDTPLDTGTEVTVHFPTPCGMQLPLRGHVLYNRQMFETPECIEAGFAIHFRPLPVAQKKLLGQYIEHCLAGDLAPFPTSNDFAQNAS